MPDMISQERYAPVPRKSYVLLPDGTVRVDPAMKDVVPFWLLTEPEEVVVPAATEMCEGVLCGPGVSAPAILPIDNKGPFEAFYSSFYAYYTSGRLAGQFTDQFMVTIFDPEYRPVLMNREIHARTLAAGFGSAGLGAGFGASIDSAAGRPFVWPETFFMEPTAGGKALFIGFRNLTTYPIKIKWAFHGVRYYDPKPFEKAIQEKQRFFGNGRISWPYFYTTDTDVLLGSGVSREYDIRITDEADIEIFKMNHYSDYPFLWRFQEKAGKRFMDSAGPGVAGAANGIHSDFGWGDAEFPFIPFETLYLEQNSKLKLVLTNSLYPYTNRIFPTLVCRKITHAGK